MNTLREWIFDTYLVYVPWIHIGICILDTFLVNVYTVVTLLKKYIFFGILRTGTNGPWGDLDVIAIYPSLCRSTQLWERHTLWSTKRDLTLGVAYSIALGV